MPSVRLGERVAGDNKGGGGRIHIHQDFPGATLVPFEVNGLFVVVARRTATLVRIDRRRFFFIALFS